MKIDRSTVDTQNTSATNSGESLWKTIACNQTLAIMLTHQLCPRGDGREKEVAIDLEDTAVVLAPLVPWSIAGAVPLATVGAPTNSLFFACFLYLLPMWRLVLEFGKKHRTNKM